VRSLLKYGFGILLLIGSGSVFAQDDPGQDNLIQRKIETIAEILEEGDENLDFNTLLDELLNFAENPININTARADQLAQLPMLNDMAVANLMGHIKANGKLLNVYELQSVNGFTLDVIRQLEPFVKVSDDVDALSFSFKEMFKDGKHELVLRYQQVLEPQAGYAPIEDSLLALSPNSRYLGSQQKYYARYRFQFSNKVSWGLTMEKDAGEEFFKGSMKQGFDFYSGHIFVRNLGVVKAAGIGDFQAQFGQGLVFWSGLAFGKSSDGVSVKRSAMGLRPYTSVDENRFLRGAGTTLQFGNFEVTAFGSYKLMDANISTETDTLNEEEETVSSVFSSGFHRTPGELEDRQSISEAIYGGNVSYKGRRLSIGITAVGYQYSAQLKRGDDLSNFYEFSGKQNSNYGLDYGYIWRNLHFYGEFALSQNLGFATTNGVLMTIDPRVTVTAMVRYFQPKYQALYANPVAESSRSNNETGYYLGFNVSPLKNWYLTGYFDIFKFPWLRYQVNGPSYGYEVIGQLSYRPTKTFEVYFRYRQKTKQLNESADYSEEPIRGLENERRNFYRLNLSWNLNKAFTLKSRVEYVRYKRGDQDVEQGFMLYQDFTYNPLSFPFSFSARLAYFDTETYNARIYVYESDVLYAYSFPAYYYRGMKAYLTIRYDIHKNIDLWVRVANLFYSNQDHVGSGLEETAGKHRTEIKVQLRFNF
jgi:hypothetical protein